jgi:hypothetical protein
VVRSRILTGEFNKRIPFFPFDLPKLHPMTFDFCIPTKGTSVPSGPDWFQEIKYDRLRLERDGSQRERRCGFIVGVGRCMAFAS